MQTQDEDRIQVLRVEQRSPEADNVLNLVLDMAEEKLATAKEKASRKCPAALGRACPNQADQLPCPCKSSAFGGGGEVCVHAFCECAWHGMVPACPYNGRLTTMSSVLLERKLMAVAATKT